ncbi:STAS domain-containing protein [Chitinophagaceae bacterium LB-8]|uniref:STAS domain-containing protein n=1 Tax=Paraflavisolibacter caeni TaxID=2982496 RepID=A0A9X3B785_9BACT|nr:STAS domain-containing protein [Paraflavisolibacter caeni]MCU7548226.1 STAS domain-containing protein [Paraflavisolibacter caeni]
MEVKTDTKEKFHAIRVVSSHLTANMAADLYEQLAPILQTSIPNVVLNVKDVKHLDEDAAELVVKLQQHFYDNNASFVICNINREVEDFLEKANLLELMNITPTESEAWDIVQMEEIERELLNDEGDEI